VTEGSSGKGKRFLYIDGLRGVAAMMVVLYHVQINLRPAVRGWFPHSIDFLFHWGNLGVDIFFVLSGFVIAHSVRNGAFSWAYMGRFAFRRSIRLDPPLWVTIALELLLIQAGFVLFPGISTVVPSWEQVLANVTYTQRFFHLGDVVGVFWSLTYEVQFYFVLVLALVAYGKTLDRRIDASTKQMLFLGFLIVPHLYSLFIYLDILPLPLQGLFIDRWFQFSLGILAWAVFRRMLHQRYFWIVALVTIILAVFLGPSDYRRWSILSSSVTAISLVLVGKRDAMHRVLAGPVIQFLGRISYSLYLIHPVVGWRFVSVVKEIFGPDLGVILGSLTLLGGVLISVASAWLMYVALEAPSLQFAHKIGLPKRSPAPTPSG